MSQSVQDLEDKLKTAPAEDKPYILNQLSEASLKSSPDKSINYADQALKAAKAVDDINEEANALINLGEGYTVQSNYKKAIINFKEALILFEQYKQYQNAAFLWNRIADIHLAEGKQQEAIDVNQKSLSNYRLARDKKGIASILMEIGDTYSNQKKFENAVNYYDQSLKGFEELRDSRMVVNVLNRMGSTYSNWGNFNEAYNFLNKAIDIARKNKMNSEADLISKNIETIKKNASNFQRSQTEYSQKEKQKLVMEKEQQMQQISSLSEQNSKSIEEIEKLSIENQVKEFKIKAQQDEIFKKQLEADNKAKEIELLKKDKQIKEADIQKQRLVILFVVIGLLLALVFTGFILRSLRITRQQKIIIQDQKKIVDEKNERITDSITYALTIQESVLPKPELMKRVFKDSFVLFLPKDIVSGDFYWVKDLGNELLFSVIDCTGHGVPGAFMSLHGYNHLERIVSEKRIISPSLILDELNKAIVETMGVEGDVGFVKHGMEMALVKINKQTNEIEFSGARNPGLIVRTKEIIELKTDAMPIGNLSGDKFSLRKEKLMPGDMIYLFSDGYKDQKGGPQNKRFFIAPFKEMLQEASVLNCVGQQQIILKKFNEWKGEEEQIDDICIMGIRI
ncbi:MAG: tetratricopeptide repeat protein [Bacteroidota bacterium]